MILETVAKFLKKPDLWFGKCHQEFGKFLPHESRKIGTVIGSFYPKQKMYELKI